MPGSCNEIGAICRIDGRSTRILHCLRKMTVARFAVASCRDFFSPIVNEHIPLVITAFQPAAVSLGLGTRIGPYEMTAELAKGGMGEVYRALGTEVGEPFAK